MKNISCKELWEDYEEVMLILSNYKDKELNISIFNLWRAIVLETIKLHCNQELDSLGHYDFDTGDIEEQIITIKEKVDIELAIFYDILSPLKVKTPNWKQYINPCDGLQYNIDINNPLK